MTRGEMLIQKVENEDEPAFKRYTNRGSGGDLGVKVRIIQVVSVQNCHDETQQSIVISDIPRTGKEQ